jgi:hypothetical protein
MDALAIYAAVVGSVGLGWQIWREVRRTRTDIRVEIEHAAKQRRFFVVVPDDPDPRPEPLEYEVSVVVVNDGETTEYVRGIYLESRARTEGYHFGNAGEGDQVLRPRSRIADSVRLNELDFDASRGVVGIVELASGRSIESKLEMLNQNTLDHIAEWNAAARP